MPQSSVQEKHMALPHIQASKSMSLALKRRRCTTESSDEMGNSPPMKKTSVASTQLDDSCISHQETWPLEKHADPGTWSELRNDVTCFMTPSTSHDNSDESKPLPNLPWADSSQVWSIMCSRDKKVSSQRDHEMFTKHRTLQPHMRAILLDWLIEVCEVYKLHRETYYLAMDYIDRYLSAHENVPKNQLQLIGITCLFVTAKVEEIYPPKIAEFAYVTDGACTEKEILDMEVVVLNGLNWDLSPITPPGWLNIYMQMEAGDWSRPETFIYPQYGGLQYSQAAQILDLLTLDPGCLKFPYSQLAASTIYYTLGRECALRVSNLTWEQLSPCVRYVGPFASTVAEDGSQLLLRSSVPPNENHTGSGLRATVPNIVMDETHRIQTHVVDLAMLEKAQQRLAESVDNGAYLVSCSSPNRSSILTPPSSNQKDSPSSSPSLSLPPRKNSLSLTPSSQNDSQSSTSSSRKRSRSASPSPQKRLRSASPSPRKRARLASPSPQKRSRSASPSPRKRARLASLSPSSSKEDAQSPLSSTYKDSSSPILVGCKRSRSASAFSLESQLPLPSSRDNSLSPSPSLRNTD